MNDYIVREKQNISYFDHDSKNVFNTIRNSSNRRQMNPICFVLRKIKNIILYKWSYNSSFGGLRVTLNRKRGVTIGDNVYIGQFCAIDNAYPEYVYIEDNVSLAGGNSIIAHSNPYLHFKNIVESSVEPIIIKEGAWIGSGAMILRGVTIGKNAIVTAGTIVDKDVPDYSVARGNPMKIVSNFESLI
mgnify:CR=1 FL=1